MWVHKISPSGIRVIFKMVTSNTWSKEYSVRLMSWRSNILLIFKILKGNIVLTINYLKTSFRQHLNRIWKLISNFLFSLFCYYTRSTWYSNTTWKNPEPIFKYFTMFCMLRTFMMRKGKAIPLEIFFEIE